LLAVEQPIENEHRALHPDAAAAIVDNARTTWAEYQGHRVSVEFDRVDMAALQLSAEATWRKTDSGTIQIGDVVDWEDGGAALRALYEAAVDDLADVVGAASVRMWCEQTLITPLRTRACLSTGSSELDDSATLVIARLLAFGILVVAERSGITWYELAHDRLVLAIRESNRLRKEADLVDAAAGLLTAATRAWEGHGRAGDDLLAGEALARVAAWASAYPERVGTDERTYLDASIGATAVSITTSPDPSAL
jgi:hypothetical protein